jgi:hypothetical protein
MAKISDLLTTEPKVQSTSLLTYALAAMLRKLPPAFFLGAFTRTLILHKVTDHTLADMRCNPDSVND